MQHIFIINPIAGKKEYRIAEKIIRDYFNEHKKEQYIIHFTEYKGHAMELASRYSEGTIYAVGGDGTAHEILNGMQDGVSLAIIPVGTGNDFWRMYGQVESLEDIIIHTIEGRLIPVDYGIANDTKFLNCANIGVDALVNKRANGMRYKFMPRQLVYVYAALLELVNYQSTPVRIETQDLNLETDIFLMAVMNGSFYGGGFMPTPDAQIDDGFFDVCFVDPLPKRKIPGLFAKFFKGKHLNEPEVHYIKVKDLVVESSNAITMGLDGEVIYTDVLKMHLVKHGILLRVQNSNALGK